MQAKIIKLVGLKNGLIEDCLRERNEVFFTCILRKFQFFLQCFHFGDGTIML